MPLTQLPAGLTPFGSPVGATPRVQGRGKTFYVSSVAALAADASNQGDTPLRPFATIDYAVGQCTANRGDVIVVMENHAEAVTAADGIDLDVAGISVIGLGQGDDRPTINFTTATGADIAIDAANVRVENMVFTCTIASQTAMITITGSGDGAVIRNNEFREGTATGLAFITFSGAADDVVIENNVFLAPTSGNYDRAIDLASIAAGARLVIRNNYIYGDFDNGGITGTSAFTEAQIYDNEIHSLQANVPPILFTGAATGRFGKNGPSSEWRLSQASYLASSDGATTGTYTLFAVTGVVEIQGIYGVCTAAPTSASTIEVGVSGNTAGLIAQVTDTGQFAANEIYHDATPTTTLEAVDWTGARHFVVTNGQDIVLTVASATLSPTTAAFDFYCWWRPVSGNGRILNAT